MHRNGFIALGLAVAVFAACGQQSPTSAASAAPESPMAQTFTANNSCDGGCSGGILAHTGTFAPGVHYVDLGSVQDGVRVFLHTNVLTGGGSVQMVISNNGTTWTTYDPDTELSGTSATLPAFYAAMGFDAPGARYVGVRNSSSMDANVLLWAFGV